VSGLGIALGPVVGGLLLDHYWWGSIFLVNVPIAIVAIVVGRLIVPNSKDPAAPRVDGLGVVLSIAGVASLVYAIIQAPNRGWTDPLILTMFAAAAVSLSVFVWWELRTDQPMLNIRFFENPRFSAAALSVSLVFFAMLGAIFLLTQYLQFIHRYTPLEAGVRTAPLALVMMVFAPVSGRLAPRLGNKVLVTTGMAVAAVGLYLMSRMTPATTYPEILGAVGVLGAGMALAMTPATASVMNSVPLENAGVGSAVNDTTRELGGALGVAVMGSVFTSLYVSGVGDVVTRLPAQAAAAVKASVGAALGIAARTGGTTGQHLATVATNSFTHAMSTALLVGAFVAVGGALVALVWLPNRAERASWEGAPGEAWGGESGGQAGAQGAWNRDGTQVARADVVEVKASEEDAA